MKTNQENRRTCKNIWELILVLLSLSLSACIMMAAKKLGSGGKATFVFYLTLSYFIHP